MSETTYSIEFAKSGRAKCGKCKQPIAAKSIRIGAHTAREEDFDITKWSHPSCFKLARKYSSGAGKMSVEDFLQSVVQDADGILDADAHWEEVLQSVEEAQATKKGGRKSEEGGDDTSPLAEIKAAYEKAKEEKDDGEPASSKKAKSVLAVQLDAYEEMKGLKNADLQDLLAWNGQYKSGNKEYLIAKCVDGKVHGRLSRCELCGGHLKMTEDGKTIVCAGTFDEASQQRIPCSFSSKPKDAPRWKPWYDTEPTEEEKEAMGALIEAYTEAGGKPASLPGGGGVHEKETEELLKAAAKLDWNLTSKEGLKAAVQALQELLAQGAGEKLDLPEDHEEARTKILELVMMNRDKTAVEVLPILVKAVGWADVKAAKKEAKEKAVEDSMQCPENAPIVSALKELSELYFQGGNRNAGITYTKAVAAITELTFEITADNAKGLGKGKTKIANIGKGTAEKIHEFVTTGTIAKLEEKRADAA